MFEDATQQDLDHYFTNQVQLSRQDMTKSHEVVDWYVTKLLEHISDKDPRFGKTPIKTGSSTQRLKVGQADEFDIMVPLQFRDNSWHWDVHPNSLVRQQLDPGHVFVHPGMSEEWSTYYNSEGALLPEKVRQLFRNRLNEAITDLKLDEIDVDRQTHGPAITIRISRRSVGHVIDIDFAPMIPTKVPFPQDVAWPHPGAQWPGRDKVAEAQASGVDVVAKGTGTWRISFIAAEKQLRKNMDEEGTCRAQVHRIMKKLKDDMWCATDSKPALSSYHLKNLLFWECEKYPSSADWVNAMLSERFNKMTRVLEQCVEARDLRMFFNPKINLLEKTSETAIANTLRNMQRFRENPGKWLRPTEA